MTIASAPAAVPPALRADHTVGWLDRRLAVGLAAVVFPLVYLISDVVEIVQGDFSTGRLILTYIGEAAIPLFVLGLCAVQRPGIGRLGSIGALAYAYSFVFFTSTVVFALVGDVANWDGVVAAFGGWLTVHGAVMVLGGVAFGGAVIRAGLLPRWTGWCLIVGVILVAAASGLPVLARTFAAAGPDIAFIGMGVALLSEWRSATRRPLAHS